MITIFGGTGGLGSKITDHLADHFDVDSVGREKCDLSNVYAVDKYFKSNQPGIVLFFNNININSFIHKYEDVQVSELIRNNIEGVTYATSVVLKQMREKNFGRLIYASSITVDKNVAGTSIYAATKAYYENLVKTIAIENASKGITANCIQLGYMDGGLTYTLPEDFLKKKIEEIPAKRLGTIHEIVDTIIFLINTEYINGSIIKLTGGL